MPLTVSPGDAQADFRDAACVMIAGVEQKARYLVVDFTLSDDGFMQTYPD